MPANLGAVGVEREEAVVLPRVGANLDQLTPVLHVVQAIWCWNQKKIIHSHLYDFKMPVHDQHACLIMAF